MAEIREQVSGIGSMSKRTDMNVSRQPARYISGMPYGEGQATYNQQTAAPMARGNQPMGAEMPEIIGLNEPTRFPNEPISNGANWGAGPNLGAILPQAPSILTTVEKAIQYDTTGVSEFLFNRLNK